MPAECFWTAFVNTFDDCGAAPPPDPDPELVYVFGEDFPSALSGRAPSEGPGSFSSASADLTISGGLASPVNTSAYGEADFDGPLIGPVRGIEVVFSLDPSAITGPSTYARFRLDAIDFGTATAWFSANWRVNSAGSGNYNLQTSGGLHLSPDIIDGNLEGSLNYATFAEYVEQIAAQSLSHQYVLRMTWDAAGITVEVDGVELGFEAWAEGSPPAFENPQIDTVKLLVWQEGMSSVGTFIDAIRLIGE